MHDIYVNLQQSRRNEAPLDEEHIESSAACSRAVGAHEELKSAPVECTRLSNVGRQRNEDDLMTSIQKATRQSINRSAHEPYWQLIGPTVQMVNEL
jgi:hypothetical protein